MPDAEFCGDQPSYPHEIDDELRLVRDSVMPLLLNLGEADLVGAVAAVESALQNLVYCTWLARRFGGDHVASAVADLCTAMGGAVIATAAAR